MTEVSETKILTHLSTSADAVIEDTFPWSEASNVDHAAVVGSIKSLLVDELIVAENLSSSFYTLTGEGESILANGSQEFAVLQALEEAGSISLPELEAKVGKAIAKIGMGNCMKKKWIKKDGGNLAPLKKTSEVTDEVQVLLKKLAEADYSQDAISDKVSFFSKFYNIYSEEEKNSLNLC